MSYGLTANHWDEPPLEFDPAPSTGATTNEWGLTVLPNDAPAQFRRSAIIPVLFAIPVFLSAISFVGGGLTFLSDLAYLVLTGSCVTLLLVELFKFGERQGIGAILIYGGILVWFCHDYGSYWFLHDFQQYTPAFPSVHADTIARVLFFHCLFIDVMVIAFRLPLLRFVDQLVVAVPEPGNPRFYLALVILLLLFGLTSFYFTADPMPVSLARACLWFLPPFSGGPRWTAVRSGNTNFNISGYVAQIIQVGQIGGIFAVAYAILVARTLPGKAFGWLVWLFWTLYSFTTFRRGDIAFMAMPVLGLMFVKYHAQRDPEQRARNFTRLVGTLAISATMWGTVQLQTVARTNHLSFSMFHAMGNTMFSEGLNAWVVIPDQTGYPYNTYPGEGLIRPIPDTLFNFLIGPIPRVIWHDKPVEQFSLWYAAMISHDRRGLQTNGNQGTTVSGGAVGAWYFRYGPAGVIEGAIVYGWLMGVAERALRRAQGQPLKVFFALAFATFMFRSYRDLWWHNLYPVMIGGVVITLLVRLVLGQQRHEPTSYPLSSAA